MHDALDAPPHVTLDSGMLNHSTYSNIGRKAPSFSNKKDKSHETSLKFLYLQVQLTVVLQLPHKENNLSRSAHLTEIYDEEKLEKDPIPC